MPERATPVTLREVARAAGVSTASASRALARGGAVSGDLRRRIVAAADRLGYTPNLAARSLAERRSRLIGVMVNSLADALLADAVTALEFRLAEAGYGVVIVAARPSLERNVAVLRELLGRGAEAVVIAQAAQASELAAATRPRVPWVVITEQGDAGEALVDLGRRRGAALAGRYLLELGHRRIAVIAPAEAGTATGVLEALAANNVAPLARGTLPAQDVDAAQATMRALLDRDDPPTAVVCGSDLYALAAVRVCLERGIAVPRALSIVGFGDAAFARRAFPALSTLRVAAAATGTRLAESLLSCLERGESPPTLHTPVKLVVRESTAPAPAGGFT